MTRLAPGGPFDEEQALPPEIRANLEAAYGLDQPVNVQFGRYVAGLLHGDFGPSYKFRDFTVAELIASGLPVSLTIGAAAMLLALALGIPAGIWAALRAGPDRGPLRHGARGRRHLGAGLRDRAVPRAPVRDLAALAAGGGLGCRGGSRTSSCRSSTLALPVIAYLARLTRGSLLEVLRATVDPRGARARPAGAPVLLLHALPARCCRSSATSGPRPRPC